ncbi:MAG: hypothetical protein JWN86_1818 [Planctomycetota bacterium]|nr:hypothetical protein [Planctomycetota bacterium]
MTPEREQIIAAIAAATRFVESQPPWKQNILKYSGQPNRKTPRDPVIARKGRPVRLP